MAISARHTHAFEDFLALVRARRAQSLFSARSRYALWLAIYLAVIVWFVPDLLRPGSWRQADVWLTVLGGIAALALVMVLVDVLFDRVIYRLYYRRLATAGADVALQIGDEAIAWTVGAMSGRLPWSAVKRLVEQPDALVLFIGKVEGLVLPARAFATSDDFAAVRAMARERIHGTA